MSDAKIYWYILFARTGAEERLAKRLKANTDESSFQPFVPQKTCIFRRQGNKSLFQKVCFPGYVFIESNKSAMEFIERIFPMVYKQDDAYKFLNYGDKFDIAMREEERTSLRKILGSDYSIDISKGFKDGDFVKITSGALVGNEAMILSINKGRREAVIEISMFGNNVSVSVGLEIIEKVFDY